VGEHSGIRMLLFKAWRESRAVFFLTAATIGALCAGVVLFNVPGSRTTQGNLYVVPSRHVHRTSLRLHLRRNSERLFALLMLSSDLADCCENSDVAPRVHARAPPLPALGHRHANRVGVVEVIAIAALPLLLIPGLSRFVGRSYPVMSRSTLRFVARRRTDGVRSGLSCSVLFAGEYTPYLVRFSLFAVPLLAQLRVLSAIGELPDDDGRLAQCIRIRSTPCSSRRRCLDEAIGVSWNHHDAAPSGARSHQTTRLLIS